MAVPILAADAGVASAGTVPVERADRLQRAVITAASRACPLFASRKRAVLKTKAIREERQRLAREIHEHLAQSAYGVGLLAETAGRLLDRGDREGAADQLRWIEALVREWLAEMRICLFELRPAEVKANGLAGTLRIRLESVEERAGVRATLKVEGDTRPPLDVERELLGIAVEVLNNALKHSQARNVAVVLRQTAEIACLEIADDGVGFDIVAGRAKNRGGLAGIEERAVRIAGRVAIESAPGSGTRARIEVPSRKRLVEPVEVGAHAGS